MTRANRYGCAAVAACAMTCAAGAATWDFNADWSSGNGNPNGAWSYGWMPVGFGELHLFTNAYVTSYSHGWSGWAGDGTPGQWQNDSDGWPYGVPPHDVSLHPGPGTEPCVARWTAPAGASGAATVTGEFLPGDGGAMTVGVRHNGETLWIASDAGAFDLSLSVNPGDTIDFAVYGGYWYGNTPLRAKIVVGGCLADLDGSGAVDAVDLAVLIGAWGGPGDGDLDGNGVVDAADLSILLGAWGGC